MTNKQTLCVIPARYGSTRLPGKPLLTIQDKPLIMWAYDSARRAEVFDRIVVATDNEKICETVNQAGGEAIMTRNDHSTGTSRVQEVAGIIPAQFIVNLQGDEPDIPAEVLRTFVTALHKIEDNTLLTCVSDAKIEELENPNAVKVVCDNKGKALYFSRSPIPYNVRNEAKTFLKHAGIYGFSAQSLNYFCSCEQSFLEKCEKLEQLRALENGMSIYCIKTAYSAFGIDTEEDLEQFRTYVGSKSS